MKRLLVVAALSLPLATCAAAPALAATFNEADKIERAQAQAIGGPIGSPTFVIQAPSSGVINIGQAFNEVAAPYINALANALILAFVGWAANEIRKRTGIVIDQAHQATIAKALQNQAGSLLADGMVKIEGKTITVDSVAMAAAVNDLLKHVPDAARYFGLDPDHVAARIVDTIPQIIAGAQALAAAHEAAAPPAKAA